MKPNRTSRRAVALLATIAAMGMVSALLVTIVMYFVLNRKLAERRQEQLQTVWLARSGLELATARLAEDPKDYKGEKLTLIPRSEVVVTVKPEEGAKDRFQVTSEARFPIGVENVIVRKLTRTFRRVEEAGRVGMEIVKETGKR